jgi:N-acetylmuramoyl-L-alanine amidase
MRVYVVHLGTVLWWAFTSLAVGIVMGVFSAGYIPVTSQATNALSGLTIVIDPGHGGIDPGAVSASGLLEKDIVLAISRELESLLNQAAVRAFLTRRGDYDLADNVTHNLLERKRQDLQRRVELAEDCNADLYIAIHANYFPSSIWSGAQTFYYDSDVEGKRLAEAIQAELVRVLGPNKRLARPGNYRVLRDTTMPAAIVEVGFLSNPREAALLADPHYQARVAQAVYWGILRYLRS